MLREVPGQDDNQVIELVEIGYLSMFPEYEPIDGFDQAAGLEDLDSPPKSSAAATIGSWGTPESFAGAPGCHGLRCFWFLGDLGRFGIYQAVVCPQPEDSLDSNRLFQGKTEGAEDTLTDPVPPFEEQLRC